jgi:hypothetical protein
MNNKQLFISTYLHNIAENFNINKDQAFEIFSMAAILDKTFDEIYDGVIIKNYVGKKIDQGKCKSAY